MDDDFVYVRLVSRLGAIYVCFGPAPEDLPREMIRALNKAIKAWPRRNAGDWFFEVNPEAMKIIFRSGILRDWAMTWGIGGEEPQIYDTKIYEVYPAKLEPPAVDTKSEAFAVAIREVARSNV